MALPLFRDLVQRSEQQMVGKLADARARFEHKGDRGTAGAEAPFRSFLEAARLLDAPRRRKRRHRELRRVQLLRTGDEPPASSR